ncbi:MAG: cyclic nucleotide-binding domain-containing protein [Acidobacteriota bacterium]|jgi:CRP-like cAMP-binding protein
MKLWRGKLDQIHLLKGLEADELAAVTGALQREQFPAGTVILDQGYGNLKLFILVEGKVQILRKAGKLEALIGVLEPFQTFGEMSVVDGRPVSATVRAESDVTALALSRDRFEALTAESPRLAARLWENLCRELVSRIRSTTDQVQDYFAVNQALCENETFREFYRLYGL